LRRMPALGDKLEAEWRKNKNYAAALVLVLHTAPAPRPYLGDAAKTDDDLRSMLYDMATRFKKN
jgi:hypothetical protein